MITLSRWERPFLLHDEGPEKEHGGHQWMITLSRWERPFLLHYARPGGEFCSDHLSAIFWTTIKIGLQLWIKLSAFSL
jgi:hypothetical protein